MKALHYVRFIPAVGPMTQAIFESAQEADALYDRAVMALSGINTKHDGMLVPFSLADAFGYKATVNLVGVVIDRISSELSEIINAAYQEAVDIAKEKHGRSKVGI